MLDIRHLRSLLAIAQHHSLARAAEHLHLTQSALSHQIKALEHYYSVSLFYRQQKPLKLTAAGQRLLDLAQQVLPLVDNVDYGLRRMAGGQSGRLHITIECHSCFEWLIPVLDQYRQDWPEVEVDIRLGINFDPIPALAAGDIDLVITSDQQDQQTVQFEPLFEYEALVAMANQHPLTTKTVIAAEDFLCETLITYPVEQHRLDIFSRFLRPAGMMPKQVRQSELTAMIIQWVASGRGIAVLPDWVLREYMQRQYITSRPLLMPDGAGGMHGTVFAAIRCVEYGREYIQAFLQLARDWQQIDE